VSDYLTAGICQRNTWLEVLIVEAVDTFFIPKVVTIMECVVLDAASTKTEVGGPDNSGRDS